MSSSSPSSTSSSSSSTSSPSFSSSSSSLKQKYSELLQSWYTSLAKLQHACRSVYASNSKVNMLFSTFLVLYLIFSPNVRTGPSPSQRIFKLRVKFLKQSVSLLKRKEMRMSFVFWSTSQQWNSLIFPKQSTSTSSVMRPYFSKTIPQKSSMAWGTVFLGSELVTSPVGLYSLSSTLFPIATSEICLQIGCFISQYLSLTASISAFICWLKSNSCCLRAQRAAHVSCSPPLVEEMRLAKWLMSSLSWPSSYYSMQGSAMDEGAGDSGCGDAGVPFAIIIMRHCWFKQQIKGQHACLGRSAENRPQLFSG